MFGRLEGMLHSFTNTVFLSKVNVFHIKLVNYFCGTDFDNLTVAYVN